MAKKKTIWLYVLEIVIVLVAVGYVVVTREWPNYKNSLGSSEQLFSSSEYKTGIEVKIPSGPEFFLVINEEEKLSFIFLENSDAISLANQDIEGKNIEQAIPLVIQNLIDRQKINNQVINIINYNDLKIFNNVVSLISETLTKNNLSITVQTDSSTLKQKAEEENIESEDENDILWTLYLVSREIMDETEDESTKTSKITKDNASIYADNIYDKLTTYMVNANIKDQDRNNLNMPIQYIPGDTNNSIYPTSSSWYYIENYQIYAEITIDNYTYCYSGSKQEKKEGMCA